MRVTLIGPFPPFRGGISDFNSALINELKSSNILQIINFTTQYPQLLFPGKTQYKEESVIANKSEQILSSINPLSWRKTAQMVAEFQPEIIIIHYWMPFFGLAYGKVIRKIKKQINPIIIAVCHNLIPHEKRSFDKRLSKYFLNKVDRFVVMSKSVADDLKSLIPNAKYRLTPHPIYNIFGESIDKTVARKKLGINAEKVILYFGLIREYKGLDILLESIPQIQSELNDLTVLIAGECYEDEQKYYSLIDQLDIKKYIDIRLKFIRDDEVAIYFSAADVIALPYRTATQSGITQIAFHYDRPVIVSNVGGLSEIVPDGKVGYVVEPNPNAFAKAITKYFKEEKFKEFSHNLKQHKKLFSWQKFVDVIMGLVKK